MVDVVFFMGVFCNRPFVFPKRIRTHFNAGVQWTPAPTSANTGGNHNVIESPAASFCSRGGYVCLTGQFASRASRRVLAASSCLARARKENPNSLLALQLWNACHSSRLRR